MKALYCRENADDIGTLRIEWDKVRSVTSSRSFEVETTGGRLVYGYNYLAEQRFKVQSDKAIPEGDHIFSFQFIPTGKADIAKGKGVPATIKLFVDGSPVGTGDLPVTIPLNLGLSAGVCVGADAGAPVMTDADYKPPFPFTGALKKALVDVTGEAIEDKAEKMRVYLAHQ